MSAALSVSGLTRWFSGAAEPALRDVDLAVGEGECVAVLGPSGSGKSTLLRLVAGLDRPDAGRIALGGTDLAGVAPERRGMAMVAQRPLLLPHLTALDAVAFSARARGTRRAAAREDAGRFLALVGLGALAGRRPDQLSGGQQQRVALARALAARPAVLLLDEPFSALDAELRLELHDLLRAVRRQESPTMLLVTHDRDEATALADRIALLQHGRLLQVGPPEELFEQPASPEVHRLMGGRDALPGRVRGGVLHTAWGPVAAPGLPDGDAVALVRQERVRLGEGVEAGVAVVRRTGMRFLVTVERDGERLHVETTDGPAVGTTVRVRLPDRVQVLPAETGGA